MLPKTQTLSNADLNNCWAEVVCGSVPLRKFKLINKNKYWQLKLLHNAWYRNSWNINDVDFLEGEGSTMNETGNFLLVQMGFYNCEEIFPRLNTKFMSEIVGILKLKPISAKNFETKFRHRVIRRLFSRKYILRVLINACHE